MRFLDGNVCGWGPHSLRIPVSSSCWFKTVFQCCMSKITAHYLSRDDRCTNALYILWIIIWKIIPFSNTLWFWEFVYRCIKDCTGTAAHSPTRAPHSPRDSCSQFASLLLHIPRQCVIAILWSSKCSLTMLILDCISFIFLVVHIYCLSPLLFTPIPSSTSTHSLPLHLFYFIFWSSECTIFAVKLKV